MLRLTSWIGRPLRTSAGRRRGRIRDVAVQLWPPPVRVVGLIVSTRSSRRQVPWSVVSVHPETHLPTIDPRRATPAPGTAAREEHRLLLVRDVLDGRVYDVRRRRTARVAEVWLREHDRAWEVAGLEVGARAMLRRLRPRRGASRAAPAAADLLPLCEVHLLSRQGHRAQLHSGTGAVHRLEDDDLAHLLTHLPADDAAEVTRELPAHRVGAALARLHPHIRSRLDRARLLGRPLPRTTRTRRTDGWRLYLPHPRRAQR